MLTRDEVIWAFRFLLGRSPENEQTLLSHSQFADWAALRQALMRSEEFRSGLDYNPFPHKWVFGSTLEGQRRMWVDLGDRFVSRACLLGHYEPTETAFVRRHLRPGQAFVDIGANIGWYSMVASLILGEDDPITSFEPRPETATYLRRTIADNGLGGRITLHQCGLADHEGRAFINSGLDTDNPGGSFMTASATSGMDSFAISLRTLDSFDLQRVDFIKMDVEGAEPLVVAGARRTLARCRPIIMAEINPAALRRVAGASPDDFLRLFMELGYRVEIIDELRGGEAITAYPADWDRDLMNVGLFPQ